MNSTETRLPEAPQLSPDFAARVIQRADIILARRRQARRVIAAAVTASVIAVVIGLRVSPAPPRAHLAPLASYSESDPDFLADFDTGWSSSSSAWSSGSSQDEQGDALNYLFPDAASLARFINQYSASTYGGSLDEETLPSQHIEGNDELL